MSKITFKKFLAALLSVVMVLTILPVNIPTSATTNDYYYDIFDGAVEIYEYCGEDTTVNIPSTIEGYPVVTIGDSAFYYNTNIKGVIIPDSVKRIGVHAFAGCIELSSVTFGEGVTTIEDYAFYNCASLVDITLPKNLDYLGDNVFNYCDSLEGIFTAQDSLNFSSENGVLYNKDKTILIDYPMNRAEESYAVLEGVKEIDDYAITSCNNLVSISLPKTLTTIGDDFLFECTQLDNITVSSENQNFCAENGVLYDKNKTEIIKYAQNKTDESFIVSNSVTKIFGNAFNGAANLLYITIPDSVLYIGDNAFLSCGYYNDTNNWEDSVLYIDNHLIEASYSMEGDYTIKTGTKTLADFAFTSCSGLNNIYVPDSVEIIGDYVFEYCMGLKNITLGNGVKSIGESAFLFCQNLTEITIPNSVTTLKSLAFMGCDHLENVVLPNNITTLESGLFAWCSVLDNVIIPASVTSIKDEAFTCCGLTNIDLKNVESIGEFAFMSCADLTAINLPITLKTIGSGAFAECGLYNSVTIPKNVNSIGEGVFTYCGGLIDINVVEENTTYSSKDGILFNKDQTVLIACPNGKAGDYTVPSSVNNILSEAFFHCSEITNLEVEEENQVYSSFNGVIYNKDKTELILCPEGKEGTYVVPNSVTTIGDEAFLFCYSLTGITLGDNVKTIGNQAFYMCEFLNNIDFGESLESIGECAFYACESLSKIALPDSVKTIGYGAFFFNLSLKEINIPSGITSIGDYAFAMCESLEKAIFSDSKNAWENVEVGFSNDELLDALVYQPKTVKLSATLYTYNGKVKSPSVIVKTASGETVSTTNYSYKLKTSGKYVGEHKITVTFKGDYSGTKNLYFTIKPGSTTVKKLTPYTKSIKVYLNKKTTQTSGYQVEWSTSKKFTNSKKALIKSNKTTSYTIKSLSRKKTYYVRVRTYKTVNGERIYSSYSSYKYTKTK